VDKLDFKILLASEYV